jgi:hypothetical protein
MSSDERYDRTYVTQTIDPPQVVKVNAPLGWIMPPTITLFRGGFGDVLFYDAEAFGLAAGGTDE